MSVEEELVAKACILLVELESDHKTFSAVFLDCLVVLECFGKIFSHLGCILYKVFILNDIQNC